MLFNLVETTIFLLSLVSTSKETTPTFPPKCTQLCSVEVRPTSLRQRCTNVELEEIPHDCIHPNVTVLSLEGNRIEKLIGTPFLRYSRLEEIDLESNRISEWEESVFQNLSVHTLKLSHNSIRFITKKHFLGLNSLALLYLSENDIQELNDYVFVELCDLRGLQLDKNRNLNIIGQRAFAGLHKLEGLDLSHTKISTFPYEDIPHVINISTVGAKNLKNFPTRDDLPKIRRLHLNYPAHCCMYQNKFWYHPSASSDTTTAPNTTRPIVRVFTGDPFGSDDFPFGRKRRESQESQIFLHRSPSAQQTCTKPTPFKDNLNLPEKIFCEPEPDEFNSCFDVMGWWPLRIFIWIILLINFAGNLTVIAVTIVAYHRFTAARLLLINMAFADLCMGIYLLTISIVDAKTYDEYANHAIAWKTGGGCAFAGFISVFSSELSLYTLTSITIERLYRLQNALYFKKMRMKQAILIVAVGWIFALVMATLPLVGINDYTVSAICLPFDVSGGGKIYITILLCLNAVAFFIILTVYTYLFLSITGGKWNHRNQDVTVFRKMSLLVAVDFLCWCPIIVLGLLAAYQGLAISLGAAKVIMVFIYPLNACANPFLYVIFTVQFRRDFFEFWYKKFGLCHRRYRMAVDNMDPTSPHHSRNFPGDGRRRGTEHTNLPANAVEHRPSQSSYERESNGGILKGESRKISAGSNTEVAGQIVGENSLVMEATNHLGTLTEETVDVSWLSESATV